MDQAANVSSAELTLRHSGALGWMLALAVALGVLTWWTYRRDTDELISPGPRRVLIALRIVLFSLLLLLLLRPVLAFTVETSIRRTLLMLVDASGSMKIQDPRFDDADLKRVAIAKGDLAARKGLEQTIDPAKAAGSKFVARVNVMKAALLNEDIGLDQRLRKEFDLATFTFGAALAELAGEPKAWQEKLDPSAPATALGDAVRDLLMQKRGQPLAGIFLITDGANNTGSAPLDAARLARSEGVPLYIYGVGITSPRDIIVGNFFVPEVAFVKDELPVTVRVRGQGLRGQTVRVILRLGDEVVANKEVTFQDDDEQTVPLPFTPANTGEFELRASVEPRDDEATKDNNAVAQRVRVIDSKVKVLYVESAPRWEFRYLQGVLLRDRRVDLKCVLIEGDASIGEAEGSPYLARLPQTKEELFKYDLIIIGDVAAKDFAGEQLAWVTEFVSKFGGSVLFIAGPRANPQTFKGTPVEPLLPVEFVENAPPPPAGARPVTLELTAQGRTNPMLKLSPKDEENSAIWRGLGKLYWVAQVGRAKPAAQVLLQDDDAAKATRFGKMPVIAQQQYGLGQALYIGTDNTWRWRRNAGDKYYPLLWGQIAQKMGLHHLLGGSKRTQLSVDKQSYTTGGRVAVFARLYQPDFSPVREPQVAAGYVVRGTKQDVALRTVPGEPGMFRGDFVALAAGMHEFSVDSDPATKLQFDVTEPRFELGETAMNEPLLRQMADLSGGVFFREENLFQLPDSISAKSEKVRSTVDAELWSSPIFFLLLAAVASVEWALRKRWQLK